MNNQERIKTIEDKLQAAFSPEHVEVEDESHLHAGHAGAKSGAGHFNLLIVCDVFKDKSLIQRHRMVYDVLNDMMQTEIHALSIKAYSPEEI